MVFKRVIKKQLSSPCGNLSLLFTVETISFVIANTNNSKVSMTKTKSLKKSEKKNNNNILFELNIKL